MWGLPWDNMALTANIFSKLVRPQESQEQRQLSDRHILFGPRLLSRAADAYMNDTDACAPSVNLGINRSQFLPTKSQNVTTRPFFSLLEENTFLANLKDDETRILFLRRLASWCLSQHPQAASCDSLIRDPLESSDEHAIIRVLGNIGLPGFAIFSSGMELMVSEVGESSWKVINRNLFDGRPENAFGSTSMHLSFTNWERSIEEPTPGGPPRTCSSMESVVSVREAGRWVGDVDVVRALRNECISKFRPQPPATTTVMGPTARILRRSSPGMG
ncbi:LOW QUALITY PROTEIN: hypothetical protein ColTof4_09454 [Colletotrichum tofieldiae]|nr:LOW QUALITY PROTEIN: hypothetical protein ColTof3_04801 [Colletotrichum tofieldiae]GKT77031.1 LOW QUALITY PROTEIN: hypothetical protein ColTof4_09454 [Colletotrichum tofieldiae]